MAPVKLKLAMESIGLEDADVADATDAVTAVELEHTWFAQISDISQLVNAASSEQQEQWSARCEKDETLQYDGSVRVRKVVTQDDETIYFMTIKNYQDGKRGCLETEFLVNEEVFNSIRRISPTGMIKTRYVFPIDGTDYAWEIDVFRHKNGAWCKIDLEVDNTAFKIPPFPIDLRNILDGNTSQKQILMDHYFLTPNPNRKDD